MRQGSGSHDRDARCKFFHHINARFRRLGDGLI
jgi:hypothetical protein